MTQRRDDNVNPLWIILAIIAIAALVLAFAPGMLVLAIANDLASLNLDTGQMWTFGVIVSLGIFAGFYFKNSKQFKPALTKYAILSIAIVALFAILGFGFKLQFAEKYWNYFFG